MTNNSFTRNRGVVTHISKNTQPLMANNRYEANQVKDPFSFLNVIGLVVLIQNHELNITSSNFTNNQVVEDQGAEMFGAIINIIECAHADILDIKFDNNQGYISTQRKVKYS